VNLLFEKMKREPLLPGYAYYQKKLEFYENGLIDPEIDEILASPQTSFDHKRSMWWLRTGYALRILILRFSAGEEVASLRADAIRAFEFFEKNDALSGMKFRLWEPDAYQYIMWLLSLAALLGLKEWIPKIALWISTDPDDGQDILVSRLFERFHVNLPSDELIHEKPYADLLRATETQGEAQQQAMTDYLKRWYRGMKDCYWYDDHKHLDAGFFGYWSFEAGLVTYLWNIDDSSYRDMRFYPKDLVDFARQQHEAPLNEVPKPHISRQTGEACPYSGRWGVRESPNAFLQERMFRAGDIFPPAIRRDNTEGPVTWIVLMREDGGPTRME